MSGHKLEMDDCILTKFWAPKPSSLHGVVDGSILNSRVHCKTNTYIELCKSQGSMRCLCIKTVSCVLHCRFVCLVPTVYKGSLL